MPSKRVRKRLFERVLVWVPASGTILDLPTRFVLEATPSESEEYATIASGSKRPTTRTHSVQIPVTAKELGVLSEVIHRTRCPVKAAFISSEGKDCFLWLEETRLQVRDPEIGAGLQAEKILDLESSVFYPGIWEGRDLFSGVPWQGTEDREKPNGDIVLRPQGNERAGYEGPIWTVDANSTSGRTVNLLGAQSGFTATLEAELPAWGATLRLQAPEGYAVTGGALRAKDFGGSVLASDSSGEGAEITLPEKTFKVEVEISSTEARPRVVVVGSGVRDLNGYIGKSTPDCTKVSSPNYDRAQDINEAPFWKQKETLIYDPDNAAPVWENRDNLEFATEGTESNIEPDWEDRDNLEYTKS